MTPSTRTGEAEPRTALIVLHEESLGGASVAVVRLVPALQERGWRPVFWAPRPSPAFDRLRELGLDARGEPRPIAHSLRGLRLPPGARERLGATPRYLRSFREAIRAERPAVVHANSLLSVPEAVIARATGHPVVVHSHEMLPRGPKGTAVGLAARLGASVAIAPSEACARSMARVGLDARVVHEATPIPAELPARRHGAPLVVGTVGTISRRKGSDLFVEAATRMMRDRDDVEFRMIGGSDAPFEAEWARGVLARAEAAGIGHSESADVETALKEWDLFVLPSREDPFPIAMLEAMAAGLPVIGAAVDGVPEQIAPGTGLLVQPENAGDLATAIRSLLESPDRRATLGAAARKRVAELFTLERQADGVQAAYTEALARSGGD